VSSVFFGDSFEGEVDFVLVRLLGPFLSNVGTSHIDGFPFFGFSDPFDCFSLHEEDLFSDVHVVTTLELDGFSQDLSTFPIDFWIEVVEEGVA
jgi:hypothetical protein